MSLFCASCERLSRAISTLKPQYIRSQRFYKSLPSAGFSLSSFHQVNFKTGTEYPFKTFAEYPHHHRRSFFSQSKLLNLHDTNEKKEGGKNVEELEVVDEENLTEEEKEVLKVLEEEERKLRESFKGGLNLRDDDDYSVWDPSDSHGKKIRLSESVSASHVTFENRKRIIQDVIDEMWNPLPEEEEPEPVEPEYYPRGKTGVFDLGELVDLLKDEGADELVAIALPKELDYADYMVIVTVMNNKHLVALATFVRKRFKSKDRKKTDVLPFLNKKADHKGWIALDLGNIILQIFTQDVRDYFDLETLWTVGPLFDDLTNAKDPEIIQLLNSIT